MGEHKRGRQEGGDPELQSGLVLHYSRFVCMQTLLLILPPPPHLLHLLVLLLP